MSISQITFLNQRSLLGYCKKYGEKAKLLRIFPRKGGSKKIVQYSSQAMLKSNICHNQAEESNLFTYFSSLIDSFFQGEHEFVQHQS